MTARTSVSQNPSSKEATLIISQLFYHNELQDFHTKYNKLSVVSLQSEFLNKRLIRVIETFCKHLTQNKQNRRLILELSPILMYPRRLIQRPRIGKSDSAVQTSTGITVSVLILGMEEVHAIYFVVLLGKRSFVSSLRRMSAKGIGSSSKSLRLSANLERT